MAGADTLDQRDVLFTLPLDCNGDLLTTGDLRREKVRTRRKTLFRVLKQPPDPIIELGSGNVKMYFDQWEMSASCSPHSEITNLE